MESSAPTSIQLGESKQPGTQSTESACATVKALSTLAQTLEDCGLPLEWKELSEDAVEQVLITDVRVCDHCTHAEDTLLCPVTGAPHRRRLVRTAQEMLRLLGRKAGTMYTRPACLSERMEGNVRVRTQRRIQVNPQLFLLLFYFAAATEPDVDPALVDCAQYLLSIIQQVWTYGTRQLADMDEKYAKSLLRSFCRGWRQYLRLSGNIAGQANTDGVQASTAELFRGTRDGLFAAARELAADPTIESVGAFVALLYARVARLASPQQLAEVDAELTRLQQQQYERAGKAVEQDKDTLDQLQLGHKEEVAAHTQTEPLQRLIAQASEEGVDATTANTPRSSAVGTSSLLGNATPKIRMARSPLMLTEGDTSGSDGEGAMLPRPRLSAVMGPELPPNWYVDETGRSRPLPGLQERERYLRMEFKGRKAYEAALGIAAPQTEDEKLKEEVADALGDAELSALKADLNHSPARLQRVPEFLRLVERSFVDALPRRLQPHLQQEFRDALDWNIMKGSMASVSRVLQFVVQQVIKYGAPAREEQLRGRLKVVCEDLENGAPDIGTAVANAFKFLFQSIRDLRSDIAQFTLMMVSTQLKENAVQYIREFVDGCLPKSTEWRSTIAFLQKFVMTPQCASWADTSEAASGAATAITAEERRVRGALLFGMLDLIRSGNVTDSKHRWDDFPAEAFYFEKSIVFKVANSVQESTLLLLLEGTVSSIIYRKGFTHAQVEDTLRQLHERILSLLSQDVKLDDLKRLVVESLDNWLCTDDGDVSRALSAAEKNVVNSTIDKMTDTCSPLYITFEKKVLQAFQATCTGEQTAADAAPPKLGLVTSRVLADANLLRRALLFNWEVYAPYYQQLIPTLTL